MPALTPVPSTASPAPPVPAENGGLLGDYPCDGIPGGLHVIVDGKGPQAVEVEVMDGATYKIGVTGRELLATSTS